MTDAVTLVSDWVAAVMAHDWQRAWEAIAAEALTPIGPQIVPRREIPVDLYARTLDSMVAAAGPRTRLQFVFEGGTSVTTPSGPVVLAELHESRLGDRFTLGAALTPDQAAIRALAVDPSTPEDVLPEAMADLAQWPLPTSRREGFLTPLHHSYSRRRLGLPQPPRVLPEARFSCQGRGDCCQVGIWKILVSDNERQPLLRLSQAVGLTPFALGTPPPAPLLADPEAGLHRHRLAVGAWPGCHQLSDDGRCQLHTAVGWQPVPACQLYPYHPVATPDGFDVVALFSCLTVCQNEGRPLQDQLGDLRQRLWPYQFRLAGVGDTLRTSRDGEAVLSWETYRLWEQVLLDALSDVDADPSAALRSGNRRMAVWRGDGPGTAIDADTLLGYLLREEIPSDWEDGWLGGGYRQAWQTVRRAGIRFTPHGDLLSRFLRSVLFRKEGLVGDEAGVGFPWGLTLAVFCMVRADACFRAWRQGRPETSADDLMQAVRAVEYLVGHDPLPGWLAGLVGSPLEMPATWDRLVAD